MALPNDGAAVVDHRHAAVGIEPVEFLGIEPAERAAGIDMFMRKADLADGPHRFLHVDRIATAPDLEHVVLKSA
jgi:hypothetical protein